MRPRPSARAARCRRDRCRCRLLLLVVLLASSSDGGASGPGAAPSAMSILRPICLSLACAPALSHTHTLSPSYPPGGASTRSRQTPGGGPGQRPMPSRGALLSVPPAAARVAPIRHQAQSAPLALLHSARPRLHFSAGPGVAAPWPGRRGEGVAAAWGWEARDGGGGPSSIVIEQEVRIDTGGCTYVRTWCTLQTGISLMYFQAGGAQGAATNGWLCTCTTHASTHTCAHTP